MEKALRGQPSANQGEKIQRKPALLAPGSWTYSLHNCEKISFHYVSHPVRKLFMAALSH
jgi:hypothetical protein